MPLQIVNEVQNNGPALNIFWAGFSLGFPYMGDAGMGGYWTSQNPGHATALFTEGAGPCLIIVIHCTNNHGALGHYAAHPDPAVVLQGIAAMLANLPGAVVDTIAFAAGIVADTRPQLMCEMQIVAGARQLAPGARVLWPAQNNADTWGSAMYLPATGQLALFHGFPRNLVGRAGNGNGLAAHDYP